MILYMPWGQLTEILWKMSFPHLFGKFTRSGTLAFLPALASTPWEASAFLNAALGFSTFPWISPLIPTECGFYHFDPFSGPLRCINMYKLYYIYILYIHIFSNSEIDRHVGNPGTISTYFLEQPGNTFLSLGVLYTYMIIYENVCYL